MTPAIARIAVGIGSLCLLVAQAAGQEIPVIKLISHQEEERPTQLPRPETLLPALPVKPTAQEKPPTDVLIKLPPATADVTIRIPGRSAALPPSREPTP